MEPQEFSQRLSRIATHWDSVQRAHDNGAEAAQSARGRLLQRYLGAAYRYLLGAVGDPNLAEELCQEFALRFLRGDLWRAEASKGRFRDYVKRVLINLVNDHHRQRQAGPRALEEIGAVPAAPPVGDELEQVFLAGWREEVLSQTWRSFEAEQPAPCQLLRLRIDNPDSTSAELARRVEQESGKPATAAWVRKTLQRAHAKFADLLIDEVAASLEAADVEQVREELRALDLLKFCRAALERRSPHIAPREK